jgi:hypothetical protein
MIPILSVINMLFMIPKKNVFASLWNTQEEETSCKRLKNIKSNKSFSLKKLFGII